MATRSPLNIPMVVKTCVNGNEVQLAIEARPECIPYCCKEKFYEKNTKKTEIFLSKINLQYILKLCSLN